MGVPPQPNSPPDAVPGVGCCRDVTFVAFISNPISRSWCVLLPPKSCTVTIPKCISQINGNRFNCFPGMHKVITTRHNAFCLHKKCILFFLLFFFRPVQSISFQDEETKLLLRPLLVHIANASFRAGISPSFFRYQSPSSDTSLNYD